MNTSSIVQKLWNYCNVLREDRYFGDSIRNWLDATGCYAELSTLSPKFATGVADDRFVSATAFMACLVMQRPAGNGYRLCGGPVGGKK